MRPVLLHFALVGLVVTLSLVAPIGVSLLAGESDVAIRLGFYLLIGGFLFGGMVLALWGRNARMSQVGRLALLVMIWTLVPVLASLPIADISQLSFLDSAFESVSGLTTAGASVLKTVETWPQGLIFWRVQLQWMGGYLALLTILLMTAPIGIGGLTSRTGTFLFSGLEPSSQRRALALVTQIAIVYSAMTVICAIFFFVSGTRAFYALTLAMTAVSTGGFLPFDESLDTHLNMFGIFVFAIFLLIGATSIFWQRMLVEGKVEELLRHRESYSVVALISVLTIAYCALVMSTSSGGAANLSRAVVEGFFTATSLVATSGVETRPGIISLMPLVLVLFVVFAGGSAYSTSGGLKHYRIGGMLVQSWSEIDRLIYPHAIRPTRFGTQRYDIELMKAIWSFFVVMILIIGMGTVLIATTGVPLDAALTATVSAFSTAGPVYNSAWAGPGVDGWPSYASFEVTAKFALIAVMLLGRLEALAVIALFSARYWRSR